MPLHRKPSRLNSLAHILWHANDHGPCHQALDVMPQLSGVAPLRCTSKLAPLHMPHCTLQPERVPVAATFIAATNPCSCCLEHHGDNPAILHAVGNPAVLHAASHTYTVPQAPSCAALEPSGTSLLVKLECSEQQRPAAGWVPSSCCCWCPRRELNGDTSAASTQHASAGSDLGTYTIPSVASTDAEK